MSNRVRRSDEEVARICAKVHERVLAGEYVSSACKAEGMNDGSYRRWVNAQKKKPKQVEASAPQVIIHQAPAKRSYIKKKDRVAIQQTNSDMCAVIMVPMSKLKSMMENML